MAGPLDGVRVLELGNFIAGPFAGQLLGDYGADVIKVESPGDGDPMRHWGITRDGDSLWWPTIGRNKRSITLDLRTDDGRRIGRELAAKCDVVIENFRPGVLAKWGLTYESLRAANPRVILVHVSGFGQTGPARRNKPGSAAWARRWVASATPPGVPTVRRRVAVSRSVTRWHRCSR